VRIVTLNAGSGTVKATSFTVGDDVEQHRSVELVQHTDPPTLQVDGDDAERVDAAGRGERFAALLDALLDGTGSEAIDAVAHRVVHAGPLQEHSVIGDAVRTAIDRATALAPLHNPPAVELLDRSCERFPDAVHVACIDTAFHVTLPDAATVYGGPRSWWDRGLRRYGFHGISHQDASARAAAVLRRPLEELALVTVHCGGGVSATAVDAGQSVDTTMGFTPAEGPIMAGRSGSVDPGLLIHLLREDGLDADELEAVLMERSGLLGLSGSTGEERSLRQRRATDPAAALAVDAYVHSLRRSVASLFPAVERLDGLVLTGDVLETDPDLRADLCAGLGFAGIVLDEERNAGWDGDDADLAAGGSPVAVVAVRADEETAMARIVRSLLGR
jgi:acetate kinase